MDMTELLYHDLQRVLLRTPKEVLELLQKHPQKLFVAGGFIRACIANEEVSDIDLFAPSKEEAQEWARQLAYGPDVVTIGKALHETQNAITVLGLKYPAQFIHRWTFSYPNEALQSFDFTIAKAAFWAERYQKEVVWKSSCDSRFYADLAAKRLIYTSPSRIEEAGGSLLRVLKFYQRGYRIPLDHFGATIARIVSAVDMNNLPLRPKNHRKPPYSHEQAVAVAITKLLREVDPEIDPNHIAHFPEEGYGKDSQ
jgi:hypothetical protein